MSNRPRMYPKYESPLGNAQSQLGPTFRAPTATFVGNPSTSASSSVPSGDMEMYRDSGRRIQYHSLQNEVEPLDQVPLTQNEDETWNPTMAKAAASVAKKEAALPWNKPYTYSDDCVEAYRAIYKRMGGEEQEAQAEPLSSSRDTEKGPPFVKIFLFDERMIVFGERVAKVLGFSSQDFVFKSNELDKEALIKEEVSVSLRPLLLILIDRNNGRKGKVDLFSAQFGNREMIPLQEAVDFIKLKWPNWTAEGQEYMTKLYPDMNKKRPRGCPHCKREVACKNPTTCLANLLPHY